jgi:hypothetical protein
MLRELTGYSMTTHQEIDQPCLEEQEHLMNAWAEACLAAAVTDQ